MVIRLRSCVILGSFFLFTFLPFCCNAAVAIVPYNIQWQDLGTFNTDISARDIAPIAFSHELFERTHVHFTIGYNFLFQNTLNNRSIRYTVPTFGFFLSHHTPQKHGFGTKRGFSYAGGKVDPLRGYHHGALVHIVTGSPSSRNYGAIASFGYQFPLKTMHKPFFFLKPYAGFIVSKTIQNPYLEKGFGSFPVQFNGITSNLLEAHAGIEFRALELLAVHASTGTTSSFSIKLGAFHCLSNKMPSITSNFLMGLSGIAQTPSIPVKTGFETGISGDWVVQKDLRFNIDINNTWSNTDSTQAFTIGLRYLF